MSTNFHNFRDSDEFCIFIADIGDNEYVRDFVSIFKLVEPRVSDFESLPTSVATSDYEVSHFRYDEYKKHNAESMMIDVKKRELVIITKSKIYPYAHVYNVSAIVDIIQNLPQLISI